MVSRPAASASLGNFLEMQISSLNFVSSPVSQAEKNWEFPKVFTEHLERRDEQPGV